MLSVTANKIANRSNCKVTLRYTGYLISLPAVGSGMVIFRDPHGHRMSTTPVRRVLSETGGSSVYVETDNSVYRLEIHGESEKLNQQGTLEASAVQ